MNKIQHYFQETWVELKEKVSWPTWEELQSSAIVVAIAAIIISILIFVMDSASSFVLTNFYTKF